MGVVDDFVARCVKEYDFYDKAARLVAARLEANLKAAGVRCMVTSRAKDASRLEAKCRRRNDVKEYQGVDDVFNDIADLAGVRVALYFPAERDQVEAAVNSLFSVKLKKEFPDSDNGNVPVKKFSGYSAIHYRVQLKEDKLNESDKRYSVAAVEIQVASVLMHAWSEVEHDLVYKPLAEGELSVDEYAILDQLNGMVLAGEMALETLQRAGERRIAEVGRTFVNHYELAAYLLTRVELASDDPISESGLGRVDLLFAFLCRLGIGTPSQLVPYLERYTTTSNCALLQSKLSMLFSPMTTLATRFLPIFKENRAHMARRIVVTRMSITNSDYF